MKGVGRQGHPPVEVRDQAPPNTLVPVSPTLEMKTLGGSPGLCGSASSQCSLYFQGVAYSPRCVETAVSLRQEEVTSVLTSTRPAAGPSSLGPTPPQSPGRSFVPQTLLQGPQMGCPFLLLFRLVLRPGLITALGAPCHLVLKPTGSNRRVQHMARSARACGQTVDCEPVTGLVTHPHRSSVCRRHSG